MHVETFMDILEIVHPPANVIVTQFGEDILSIRFQLFFLSAGCHCTGAIGKHSLCGQFRTFVIRLFGRIICNPAKIIREVA